jgi:allantoinase
MNRVAGIGPRQAGMDHDLYAPSPIVARPPTAFGGRNVAAYLVLHLEHWELAPPEGALRDSRFKGEFGTYQPEYRNWSTRAYGNRVGFYRIAALLDDLGIAPTVALGAAMVQTHPEIVAEVLRRGWEIAAHGFSANRMVTSRMSEAEERGFLRECRDTVARAIGHSPKGWLSQDFGTTPRTTQLLHEMGFEYTLDWSNDDQPYWQRAGGQDKALIAMPGPAELDDVQTIILRKLSPQGFVRLVGDAMDGALSLAHGQAFAIGIHPWVLGTPHRVRYLREMLESLRSRNDIHLTTAGALADHFRNLTKDS